MPWSAIAFTQPAAVTAINAQITAVPAASLAALAAADLRLSAVAGSVSFQLSPAAASAATAGAAEADFQALLETAADRLVLHPFTAGVGKGEGYSRYLAAPDVVEAMAEKLVDDQDGPAAPPTVAGLFVLLNGSTSAGLASALAAFNGVLAIDELRWAQKRAEALASHEADRMALLQPALAPYWKSSDLRTVSAVSTVEKGLSGNLSLASGHDAENTTPTDELQALIAKKQAAIQASGQAYADFSTLFQGGAGQVIYIEASSRGQLRQLLLSEDYLGFEWVQSAGISWVGTPDQLLFLRQAMGL